jgi:hypothetical protein
VLVLWSAVVALLAAALYLVVRSLKTGVAKEGLPDLEGQATILFGASSLALIFFSFFVTLVGVFGWQTLVEHVRKQVESTTLDRVRELENEIRGRVLTLSGFIIGSSHSQPDRLYQTSEDTEHLATAVSLCRRGYGLLKNARGNVRYMALNNLIYYSCLCDTIAPDYALEQAETLKRVGQEFDIPDYTLTYCRVVLQYANDRAAIERAWRTARGLLDGTALQTPQQRKEATFYVTSLAARLGGNSGEPSTS